MQTSLNLRLAANHSYIVAFSSVLCVCALYSVFVHCILCFTTLTQVFWSVVECASCVQPLCRVGRDKSKWCNHLSSGVLCVCTLYFVFCNTNTSPWPGWEGGTSQSGVITSWEVWPPGSQGRPSYLAGSWKLEGHSFGFFGIFQEDVFFCVLTLSNITHWREAICVQGKSCVLSSPHNFYNVPRKKSAKMFSYTTFL